MRSLIAARNTRTEAILSAVDEVAASSSIGGVMVTGMPAAATEGVAIVAAQPCAVAAQPPVVADAAAQPSVVATVAAQPSVAAVAAVLPSSDVPRKWDAAEMVRCDVCGSVFRRGNRSYHLRSHKHHAAELTSKGTDIK